MSLFEIRWYPDRKELRQFGLASLLMLPIIALGLYYFKGFSLPWVLGISFLGVVFFLLSCWQTRWIQPVYIGLLLITLPIGWLMSFLLLAIFYFFLLFPIGLIFRLIGRDSLYRKFDPNARSYWRLHHSPDSPKRYFNQF